MSSAGSTPLGDAPHGADSDQRPDHHQQEVEAYEYWGFLFKPDKTGTDRLKSLLRALKDVINQRYDTGDHLGQLEPDLTPTQLANFYRDLNGNYDQLFLGTPHESIAFIYKSLGCLHSLQPIHHTHAIAFTDPTVPALKTEGWIMWQTIQLLLGPEEHSGFLREAVQIWDVRDPASGEIFPKILPRKCFPETPDKHMVAWYEGVSDRLRKEADDEERQKMIGAQRERESSPPRRLHARREDDRSEEETASTDSRGPALAYFRNPLYRHVDGRPSIVRKSSKRPGVSPRPSMVGKGKEAATTFGHIVRNVGSPHLWDGGRRRSDSSSRADRRRRSNPDPVGPGGRHHYPVGSDGALPPGSRDNRIAPASGSTSTRRGSQVERPGTAGTSADGEWASNEQDPSLLRDRRRPSDSHSQPRPQFQDPSLRHSRSHDQTSTPKDNDTAEVASSGEDYFTGYDDPAQQRQSSSAQQQNFGSVNEQPEPIAAAAADGHDTTSQSNADANAGSSAQGTNVPTNSNAAGVPPTIIGPTFEPSTSPLFAKVVGRQQPQPFQPPPQSSSQQMQHSYAPARGAPPPLGPQGRYPQQQQQQQQQPPPQRYPSNTPAGPGAYGKQAIRRARDEDPRHDRYASSSPGVASPPPSAADRRYRGSDAGSGGARRPSRPRDRYDDGYDRPGSASGRPPPDQRHSRGHLPPPEARPYSGRRHSPSHTYDRREDYDDRREEYDDRRNRDREEYDDRRNRDRDREYDDRHRDNESDYGYSPPPPRDWRQRNPSGRTSASDYGGPPPSDHRRESSGYRSPDSEDGVEGRRSGSNRPPSREPSRPPAKQTRFAADPPSVAGVSGRRYPEMEDDDDRSRRNADNDRRSRSRSRSRRRRRSYDE